jgi:hypothetical protein
MGTGFCSFSPRLQTGSKHQTRVSSQDRRAQRSCSRHRRGSTQSSRPRRHTTLSRSHSRYSSTLEHQQRSVIHKMSASTGREQQENEPKTAIQTHRRRATRRGVRIPLERGGSGEKDSTKDDETRAQHHTEGGEAEQEESC